MDATEEAVDSRAVLVVTALAREMGLSESLVSLGPMLEGARLEMVLKRLLQKLPWSRKQV